MIFPDRVVEAIQGLHRLAADPSLEGATQLLEEWGERQQMYNTTESGWSRTPLRAELFVFKIED